MRGIGGGDTGHFLEITCVPDNTFKDEITALMANNGQVEGKLVKLTWLGNYQVTSVADNEIADGEIITCDKDNESGYLLGVRLLHFEDQNTVHHTPVMIKNLKYTGLIGFQDSVGVSGDDYSLITDKGAGGWGAVIAKFQDTNTVDVLF